MRKPFISLWALALFGCYVQSVRHNPAEAVFDTNLFLKTLYVDQNYQRALNLADDALRKAATADNLKQMVQTTEQKAGRLRELKAESYLRTPGKTMELFYIGRYEKGTLYHRLVLAGDASSGYKVSGVWFQDSPYPGHGLRSQFETNIIVK